MNLSLVGNPNRSVPTPGSASVLGCSRRRVRAWAAREPRARFEPIELALPPLAADEVEVEVLATGLCHSDLSMWRNAWGRTRYPLVPGHEIVGRVVAIGPQALGLELGMLVGIGWYRRSCLSCPACRAGDLNHCQKLERLLIDGHGGVSERVRCHWAWALPLPAALDPLKAGALFCAGITAYAPIARHVRPIDRVGVVGIGGLGHLAVLFARASGCEVVAIVRDESQLPDALALGAQRAFLSASSAADYRRLGPLDVVLVTTEAELPWAHLLEALGPRGRLHWLAMRCDPVPVIPAELVPRALTVSASPLGRPDEIEQMLRFCVRHGIEPIVERWPMSGVSEALERLATGSVRYRAMLYRDFEP